MPETALHHVYAGWALTSDLFAHVTDEDAVEVLVTGVRAAPDTDAERSNQSAGPFRVVGMAERVSGGVDGTESDGFSLTYLGSFDHYPVQEEIEQLLQDNGFKRENTDG